MFLEKLILECKLMISLSNCSINCNIFRIRNVSASGSTAVPRRALLPHKKKLLGLNPPAGRGLSLHACVSCACVGSLQVPQLAWG